MALPCFADSSLADLHVQRAALYKTLCSFATTDADDGLEDAISDTKQVCALMPGLGSGTRGCLSGPMCAAPVCTAGTAELHLRPRPWQAHACLG